MVSALGALRAAERRQLRRKPLEGRPRMSARRCAPSRDELRREQGPTRPHRVLANKDHRAHVVARGMRRLGRDKLEDSVDRRVHYRHRLRADASIEGHQLFRWVDVNRVRLLAEKSRRQLEGRASRRGYLSGAAAVEAAVHEDASVDPQARRQRGKARQQGAQADNAPVQGDGLGMSRRSPARAEPHGTKRLMQSRGMPQGSSRLMQSSAPRGSSRLM